MNWRSSGSPDGRLVLELDQVRVIIEPAAAALAATMRNDEQLEEISKALAQLVTSHRADSRIDHVDADVAFHLAVLAASGNELLTHFEVVLEPAIRARHELALEHLTGHEYLDAHRGVYEAIAEGSAESARAQMTELMTRSAQDIEEILQTGSHATT
ncbi:FadR/GntR family transcriptional regulator [Agromyces sp. Leaf222]|uniref:FadR/GntR family transcriptional regulator n=1 Tax=Agromyces sp. Leaf222 TaxID=1735688 RepID=UPI001F24F029|nr:FCD domain-containing protein [Agromyces sp. Leaf222]